MPTGTSARANGGTAKGKSAGAIVTKLGADTGVPDGDAAQSAALAKLSADAQETATREVQAAAEGLNPSNSVEFMGKRFRIATAVGLMPLMKFAAAADSGMDTSDFRAMAAMYSMLKDCIAPEVPPCGDCDVCTGTGDGQGPNTDCPFYDAGDWYRFEQHATATKAGADDLFPIVQSTIEILNARPTRQP